MSRRCGARSAEADSTLSPLAVSVAVLWIVVAALALVVFALVRQIGVLHQRIAPAGALMIGAGPRAGEAAPVLEVEDLAGRRLRVGGERADGRSLLLVFVSPTCPVCKTLLPVIRSSSVAEHRWLDFVLASDGGVDAQRRFVEENRLDAFPYVVSTALGVAYQVGRLPYAVLIDEQGVLRARGLINSREHLESLLQAAELGVASVQEYMETRADGARTPADPARGIIG
jgi:methylamine dehydrogenase accessory protein MauD